MHDWDHSPIKKIKKTFFEFGIYKILAGPPGAARDYFTISL
jgi:hypothetical protein